MNIDTGRADHIEDVLVRLHTGQWFGWSDSKNKVYENLVIHDDSYDKPTSISLESELQRMQDEFDGNTHQRNRVEGTGSIYPSTGEQFDMLFRELETSGSLTTGGSWFNTIKTVKDTNPKP